MVETILRRNTRQRQLVLEELRKLTTHPTAAELYEITRRRLPRISLGTVYRNLELLTQMGVVRKLQISGGEARFDGNLDQHYHLRCVRCGRVDDVHGVPGEFVRPDFESLNGYDIIGHCLEFLGICPACKGTAPKENTKDTPREGE